MKDTTQTLPKRRIISLMDLLLYGTCFSLLVVSFLTLNRLQTAMEEEARGRQPAPLVKWPELRPSLTPEGNGSPLNPKRPPEIEPVRLAVTPVPPPTPAEQVVSREEIGEELAQARTDGEKGPRRRITTTMPPPWPLEGNLPFEAIQDLKQALEGVLCIPDGPTPPASRKNAAANSKPCPDEEPPILDLGPTRPVTPIGVQASKGLGPSDQLAENEGQALLIGLGSARLRALLPLAAASANVLGANNQNYSRILLSNGDEEHCTAHIPVVIPGDWDIRAGGIVEAEMKTIFGDQAESHAEPRGKDATRQGDAHGQR